MFGDEEDLELVATVENAEDAIELIGRQQPEVVIMDVRLPGIDGISALKRIAQAAPSVKSVVFSAYGDKRLLSDAISAGARGYVMKGSPPEDLLRAIRAVTAGKPFVDPSLSPALLMTQGIGDAPLSEREREILQLLAEGYTPRRSPGGSASAPRPSSRTPSARSSSSKRTRASTRWRSPCARP